MVTSEPLPEDVLAVFDGELKLGYMATVRPDEHLAVVPVGVTVHEGLIRISSPTDTHKIRNLRNDPHVAVCIPDPGDPRRYLMIRGTAELADDVGKGFLNWLARTHMELESYPEASTVARTVITLKPDRFVMAGTNKVP